MKSFLILCFVFCIHILMAKTETIKDTLGIKLKTQISAKQRAELKAIQQQLDTASTRVSLASIHNHIARTYLKASYNLAQPKYDSVIYHSNHALLLTKDDTTSVAVYEYLQALGWLGSGYNYLGSKTKAVDYFSEILVETDNIKEAAKFYEHRQLATTKTAMIYAEQDNFELAIKQYQALLNYVSKNKIDDRRISAIVYMKLAGFYREIDSLNIASTYANKATEVAMANGKLFRAAMANLELAYIEMKSTAYLEMKPIAYINIESYLSKAFEILKESEYTAILAKYYSIKATLAEKRISCKHLLLVWMII